MPAAGTDRLLAPPVPAGSALDMVSRVGRADPRRAERWLREELAEGDDPAPSALVLADQLAQAERLEEALAVVDAGLERCPRRLDLTLARARLLRDLGRLDEAESALAEQPEHPRVLWEAAQNASARGDRAALRDRVHALRTRFADDPFVRALRQDLALLERDPDGVAADGAWSASELLRLLRGSPDVLLRLRALRTLAAAPSQVLERALRIGLADAAPVVRATALRVGLGHVDDRVAWIRAGLLDEAAMVRGAAAMLATELPRKEGIVLLTSFLDQQDDGYVLERMHAALCELTDTDPAFPVGWERDTAGRERARAYWRRTWGR